MRWRRRSLFLLALVFLVGGVLAVRELRTPAPVREATRILRAQDPNFDPAQFQVEEVAQTPSGDWRVRFVQADGSAQKRYTVLVQDNPDWWSRARDWVVGR